MSALIGVNCGKGGSDLRVVVPHPQRVQQTCKFRLVDLAVTVLIDALETVAQRIGAHARSLRRFFAQDSAVLLGVFSAICACQSTPQSHQPLAGPTPAAEGGGEGALHPQPSASASVGRTLPALRASWLEHLETREGAAVVTPPVGSIAASGLIVAVHGAGDRAEWSCGGWRLASQSSAFVVCPQGRPLSSETFAWASSSELERRVDAAIDTARARYGEYVAAGPMIYAGFSQGATLAEPLLLHQAARFPIAILAEGGYGTLRNPGFGPAFRRAGGRRLVLVCGTPGCFENARRARKPLERAGLQVLVLGDEKAGHNLNERMQHALQNAWTEIAAPLGGP